LTSKNTNNAGLEYQWQKIYLKKPHIYISIVLHINNFRCTVERCTQNTDKLSCSIYTTLSCSIYTTCTIKNVSVTLASQWRWCHTHINDTVGNTFYPGKWVKWRHNVFVRSPRQKCRDTTHCDAFTHPRILSLHLHFLRLPWFASHGLERSYSYHYNLNHKFNVKLPAKDRWTSFWDCSSHKQTQSKQLAQTQCRLRRGTKK